jgi:anti-sigma B factor antagonist
MMMMNPLTVERLGKVEGHGVLCLHGPLTIENILPFQNAIRREEGADTVILDLSEVPYIDSSGLGSLVSAYVSRQKVGRKVALTGVNERVYRLFEVTKTESLFLIFSTIDEALIALNQPAQA